MHQILGFLDPYLEVQNYNWRHYGYNTWGTDTSLLIARLRPPSTDRDRPGTPCTPSTGRSLSAELGTEWIHCLMFRAASKKPHNPRARFHAVYDYIHICIYTYMYVRIQVQIQIYNIDV